MTSDNVKRATLYRMVMDQHICQFEFASGDLNRRFGQNVERCRAKNLRPLPFELAADG